MLIRMVKTKDVEEKTMKTASDDDVGRRTKEKRVGWRMGNGGWRVVDGGCHEALGSCWRGTMTLPSSGTYSGWVPGHLYVRGMMKPDSVCMTAVAGPAYSMCVCVCVCVLLRMRQLLPTQANTQTHIRVLSAQSACRCRGYLPCQPARARAGVGVVFLRRVV